MQETIGVLTKKKYDKFAQRKTCAKWLLNMINGGEKRKVRKEAYFTCFFQVSSRSNTRNEKMGYTRARG